MELEILGTGVMNYKRTERVNELLQEEISEILLREIKDPRIGFITITNAKTASDLSHIKVFVSILGDEGERNLTLMGLRSASGYIRQLLKKRINLRKIPEIKFVYDPSIEQGDRINRILQELKEKESWEK